MNITRMDLNLLATFDAVASTGSVSAAAIKLNLSQPAVSHALNRLRKVTGDRLFVRSGNGLVPTPFAQTLQAQVCDMLESARSILRRQDFEVSRDTRTFRIAASDYAALTIVPRLLQVMRREAPYISIELAPVGKSTLDDMGHGDISLSFWGTVPPSIPYDAAHLFHEVFVGIVWNGHSLAGRDSVDLDEYLSCPHASVAYGTGTANPVETALQAINQKRKVTFIGQSFSGNLAAMRETDLVLTLPSRLIGYAKSLGFEPFTLPLVIEPYPYSIIWHNRTATDPAHIWLRKQIIASVSDKTCPANY